MRRNDLSKEETELDLWRFLIDFWVETVEDKEADRASRMRSSEFLAKYILDAGKKTVKRRGPQKPSTAEILRLASSLEKQHGKD